VQEIIIHMIDEIKSQGGARSLHANIMEHR